MFATACLLSPYVEGILVFEQSSYIVPESIGSVEVCIILVGTLTQSTTATVFTQNTLPPSATGNFSSLVCTGSITYMHVHFVPIAPDDYATLQATSFEFGPGLSTRQCVNIAIEDDVVCEDAETFNAVFVYERSAVGGPTDTVLVSAPVTITDNGENLLLNK